MRATIIRIGLLLFFAWEAFFSQLLFQTSCEIPQIALAQDTLSRKATPTSEQADPDEQKIQQLMQKAIQTDDPAKQVEYYSEILKLDPSNQIAYERRKEAQGRLEQQQQKQRQEEEARRQEESKNKAEKANAEWNLQRKQEAMDGAIESLIRDDTDQMKAAKDKIEDVLKVNPSDPELISLKARIEDRIQTAKFFFIARIALLVLVLIGLIFGLYYWLLRKKQGVLEVVEGAGTGQVLAIEKEAVKIGSIEAENDLVISDEKKRISRLHCEIFRSGRNFFIKDLSTNGTKVNDQNVESGRPARIRKGDRISLANEATLVFRLK